MFFDGFDAESEADGDAFVGASLVDHQDDFTLAIREQIQIAFTTRQWWRERQIGFADGIQPQKSILDGLQEFVSVEGLIEHGDGTKLHGFDRQAGAGECRNQNQAEIVWSQSAELLVQIQSGHLGHHLIGNHHTAWKQG
jgi:hypothetical protein